MKRTTALRRVVLKNLSRENLEKRLRAYSARSDMGYVSLWLICRPGVAMPNIYSDEFLGEDGLWGSFILETKGEMTPEGLVGLTMVSEGCDEADEVGWAKVAIPCDVIADVSGGRIEIQWYEKGVRDPKRAEGLAMEKQDLIDFPHWMRL